MRCKRVEMLRKESGCFELLLGERDVLCLGFLIVRRLKHEWREAFIGLFRKNRLRCCVNRWMNVFEPKDLC